jgi:hypothetical protein
MKRRILWIVLASVVGAGLTVAVLRYWLKDEGVEIGAHGYIAAGLGVGFTLLLGCGLMSLVYFSAKRGYDDIDERPGRPPESRS